MVLPKKQRLTLWLAALVCLAWIGPATATTYYVNSRSGDDAANGKSPGAAWRSLQKASTVELGPGDKVLFRRGLVFRGQLVLKSSGAPGRPIVYGAYGQGPKPSLRGSELTVGRYDWTKAESKIWYRRLIKFDPVVFVVDGKLGRRKTGADQLKEQWDYWYDANRQRLVIYSDGPPHQAAKSLEILIEKSVLGPTDRSHLLFQGLDFRHGYGVFCGMGADHVSFIDCRFSLTADNALQFNEGSNHGLVRSCVFDDWNLGHKLAYAVQVINKGSGPVDIEDCLFLATAQGGGEDHTAIMNDTNGWVRSVRRCVFKGDNGRLARGGIVIWRPAKACDRVDIEDNRIFGVGGSAIAIQELEYFGAKPVVKVRGNYIEGACLKDVIDEEGIRIRLFSQSSSVEVSCNIVNGTGKGKYAHEAIGVKRSTGARIYNNVVHGADDGISLRQSAWEVDVRNNVAFGNRRYGMMVEAAADPARFDHNCVFGNAWGDYFGVEPGTGDIRRDPMLDGAFRPKPGSPLLRAGVPVGLDRDIVGRPTPRGAKPDIGAFQVE